MAIGGNYGSDRHGDYDLESPAIDLSDAPGSVQLSYWRWLNGNGMTGGAKHFVEVYNGLAWVTIWSTANLITDSAWTRVEFDVTAYKNAAFKVRFGYNMFMKGATVMSGWNIDDVRLSSSSCE